VFEKCSNMPVAPSKPVKKTVSPQVKLAKLGLHTDTDLVLHLPMRYEDETQVITIEEARLHGGDTSQVEGVVVNNEITF